jgi:hypothetical protein
MPQNEWMEHRWRTVGLCFGCPGSTGYGNVGWDLLVPRNYMVRIMKLIRPAECRKLLTVSGTAQEKGLDMTYIVY